MAHRGCRTLTPTSSDAIVQYLGHNRLRNHKLVGITAFGAYIPKLRLQREAIAKANTRFGPSLATLAGAFGWALNEFVNYR